MTQNGQQAAAGTGDSAWQELEDSKHQEKGEQEEGAAEAEHGGGGAAQQRKLDPPFALPQPPYIFWQDAATLIVLGAIIGAFGYGYLKAVLEVNNAWLTADGNEAYPAANTLKFGAGRWWWILVGLATGLAVGFTKWALRLHEFPTFIEELRSMHVEPLSGLKTGLVALLGLLGGLPMGPEAGLGAVAGGFGFLVARLRRFRLQASLRQRLYVLTCMCAGYGAFCPDPMTGLLLTSELSMAPQTLDIPYMHVIVVLSFGCTASWVVYYAIAGQTFLSPVLVAVFNSSQVYDQFYVVLGLLFGIMGAALGLVYIVMAGVVKAVFTKLSAALEARIGLWPRVVAMNALGGCIYGALGYAMPLVLTDGSVQITPIAAEGAAIGSGVLAASCFAKMLAFHVVKESGFAGGLCLPMLTMSIMLGRVFVNETGVNPVVALSCSLIALASAVVPAPFFTAILSVSMFTVGPNGLVPVFACAASAYLFCMGVGGVHAIAAVAKRRQAAQQQEDEGQEGLVAGDSKLSLGGAPAAGGSKAGLGDTAGGEGTGAASDAPV